MTIAFVHNNEAFLPETEAYCRFFGRYGIRCELVDKEKIKMIQRDVEWRLMGFDRSAPGAGVLRIHEYTSTSIPPLRVLKNKAKTFLNARPDFRLFLNPYVKDSFGFEDGVPFGFRDMGIPENWIQVPDDHIKKEVDFVYLGDLSPVREPEILLDCFATGHMKERTLLLIGRNYLALQRKYASYANIRFIGPVPYESVKDHLLRARFGINFMIDKEPLNQQTSTKFLEYAAVGLPVVTTAYQWIDAFQQQYGGDYLFVKQDLSDLTWERVSNTVYAAPDLRSWTWEEQIKRSGVLEFLSSRFAELKKGL